jgi:hypothetical protein
MSHHGGEFVHAQEKSAGKKPGNNDRTPLHRRPVAVPDGTASGPMTPTTILALQRSAGNLVVSRVLEEEHAHGPDCGHGAVDDTNPVAQRELLDAAQSSPGHPIPSSTRQELESFFQSDLSAARIHTDPVAQRATAAMGAKAMTIGSHVFFSEGADRDKKTFVHEGKHVIENINGVPETGNDTGAGVHVTDPNQKSERTASADEAAFSAGAKTAPSITAQRAVTAGAPDVRASDSSEAGEAHAEIARAELDDWQKERE